MKEEFWIGAVVFGFIGLMAARLTYLATDAAWKREAILAHAAHYEPDAKGDPVFTWNETQNESPHIK